MPRSLMTEVFLGYEGGGKTYKVFEHLYVTWAVIFDEEQSWD